MSNKKVRDSESTTGDFSVSLKAPGRNKHFRVHVEAGDFFGLAAETQTSIVIVARMFSRSYNC